MINQIISLSFLPLVIGDITAFFSTIWEKTISSWQSKLLSIKCVSESTLLFSHVTLSFQLSFFFREIIQSEINTEEPAAKKVKKDEVQKVCVTKELDFVPLRTALAVKSGKSGIGITKRTSPVLILTHILFEFHAQYNRFPNTDNRLNDINALKKIQEKVLTQLELPPTAIKDLEEEKYYDHVFGELSPISAIVGGLLGQDIIRSITNQDAPIRNFFFFDGFKCQGSVESIGK